MHLPAYVVHLHVIFSQNATSHFGPIFHQNPPLCLHFFAWASRAGPENVLHQFWTPVLYIVNIQVSVPGSEELKVTRDEERE
jgi:hypothetical protein